MLRLVKSHRWLCLAIFLLFAFFASLFIPYYAEICEKRPYSPKEYCSTHQLIPFLFLYVTQFFERHAETFTALFTVVLAISTILLWWSTRRLSEDSRRQIAVAEETLVASNRPWISILSTSIQSPLTWEEKGARTSIEVNIKNVGKNPAFDIAIEAYQFVMGRTTYDTGAAVNKFRAEVRKRQIARARIGERGEVLLPDESFRMSHGLLFAKQEIMAEAKCEGKVFFPVVVVCVDYRSSITGNSHATCLAYWLGGLSTDETLTQSAFGMARSPVGSFAD